MKIIFVFIIIAFDFFTAFGQKLTEIDFPELLKHERKPLLSEIASDIQFIKLETSPNCMVSSIRSITAWGNNYLILTNGGNFLMEFTKEGNFVKMLFKGSEIYGITIDPQTNHLYLLVNGEGKVFEYGTDGKLLREIKLDFYATDLKTVRNGFVFYTGSVYAYRTDNCLLTLTDSNCQVTARFHKHPLPQGIPYRLGNLYLENDEVVYWEPYWDTVYTFDGSSHNPKYYFNIGKDRIPQSILEESNMFTYDLNSFNWLIGYKEFANFIYFEYIDYNRLGKKVFYDKRKKSGYSIPGDLLYNNWGFVNDFSGGPMFILDLQINSSEVACWYKIKDLKEYLKRGLIDTNQAKNGNASQELIDIINNSNNDDNLLVAVAKLKSN